MTSGTMLIRNYLGEKTTLVIINDVASSIPTENALPDAKNALILEKKNPTVSSGNIAFLTLWIRLFNNQLTRNSLFAKQSTISQLEAQIQFESTLFQTEIEPQIQIEIEKEKT